MKRFIRTLAIILVAAVVAVTMSSCSFDKLKLDIDKGSLDLNGSDTAGTNSGLVIPIKIQ